MSDLLCTWYAIECLNDCDEWWDLHTNQQSMKYFHGKSIWSKIGRDCQLYRIELIFSMICYIQGRMPCMKISPRVLLRMCCCVKFANYDNFSIPTDWLLCVLYNGSLLCILLKPWILNNNKSLGQIQFIEGGRNVRTTCTQRLGLYCLQQATFSSECAFPLSNLL